MIVGKVHTHEKGDELQEVVDVRKATRPWNKMKDIQFFKEYFLKCMLIYSSDNYIIAKKLPILEQYATISNKDNYL